MKTCIYEPEKECIGILGGMGSYATLNFFKQILDAFPAEKEWGRPRILIDNRCSMPSRVRAILYDENRKELISDMSDSVKMLIKNGASYIVFDCNTSHVFIDDVYERVPEAKGKIVNIIEETAKQVELIGAKDVYLLATEGTIETKIFSKYFESRKINIVYPEEADFEVMRRFIESVKQNKITKDIIREFGDYITSVPTEVVILGCTELPILYSKCSSLVKGKKKYIDPLDCAILEIKRRMNYQC